MLVAAEREIALLARLELDERLAVAPSLAAQAEPDAAPATWRVARQSVSSSQFACRARCESCQLYSLGNVEACKEVGNVLFGRLPGKAARANHALLGLVCARVAARREGRKKG